MGHVDAARVDVAALLHIVSEYDAVAETVAATARTRLAHPAFGAATAGRTHTGDGDAVRTAVDELADALRQWARAAQEIAMVLRASADRYVVADADVSSRVG